MNSIILQREENSISNWIAELLILDIDKPFDIVYNRHARSWIYEIPVMYRKGRHNLIITFDEGDRIYNTKE